MSDIDDMSFEVLGTTPINSYDENRSLGFSSDLARMRLSSSGGTASSPKSPLSSHINKENRQDVAMDILLRRKTPSDVMRSFQLPSLASEFPSLSNANLTESDLSKLQTMVAEHQQLRENLVKANAVIKTYFTAVEKWQNDVKQSKETDRRNLSLLQDNNQKLHREVTRLQEELEGTKKVGGTGDDFQMSTVESAELQAVKQELAHSKEAAKDMVSRQTYKNVERQCSQLLAENLQFKDMEQQYIDTINCLKVNHASTEELVRMGQTDLNAQRAANQKLMGQLGEVREENQVLIQQAEIYHKDFIAERDSRQRMAGEKDEVVQELNRLRMLLTSQGAQAQAALQPPLQSQSQSRCGLVRYMCPSCYSVFTSQQLLSQHMPQCGHQH